MSETPEHLMIRDADFEVDDPDNTPQLVRDFESAILTHTRRIIGRGEDVSRTPEDFFQIMAHRFPSGSSVGGHRAALAIRKSYERIFLRLTAMSPEPLTHIVDRVLKVCISAYQAAGVQTPDPLPSELALKFGFLQAIDTLQRPRHLFQGRAAVKPGCHLDRHCEGADKHWQTLEIVFVPAKFDRQTLSAIPYVLFHEIVCHVLQGPYSIEREIPHSSSEFAEGWMDRAAWEVFETSFRTRHPDGNLLINPPNQYDFFVEGSRALYKSRHEVPDENPTADLRIERAKARRRHGWQAAASLIDELSRQSTPNYVSVFLELSFKLNSTAQYTPTERDYIASQLALDLVNGNEAPTVEAADTRRRIREYVKRHDLPELTTPLLARMPK